MASVEFQNVGIAFGATHVVQDLNLTIEDGEFVVLVQGAGEDADAKVHEGRRLYARLKDHLPPSTAAKLAAELSGAPRKELYGSD